MRQKLNEWPKVLPNDNGIRPAGPPDACFYCGARVGVLHGSDCVTVEKEVEVAVKVTLEKGRAIRGIWRKFVPHSWEPYNIEFQMNESSWCASNIFNHWDDITWDEESKAGAQELIDTYAEYDHCLCGCFEGKFLRVVDIRPTIELEDDVKA